MEVHQNYKSFNSSKSIEELQYNISRDIIRLENVKLELEFYLILIDKPVFKKRTMNLHERLAFFKREINVIKKNRVDILNDIYSHANHIRNKIECEDLACDNFFIKEHDDFELKIFKFHKTISDLKFRLLQYLQDVLIN